MFNLPSVQKAIQDLGLDGWLLYDFRGLNVLARRVLGLNPEHILSRRWFYFIPARSEARRNGVRPAQRQPLRVPRRRRHRRAGPCLWRRGGAVGRPRSVLRGLL